MEISFADRSLRERFQTYEAGVRAWGPVVARKYIQRVLQLQAATSIRDIQSLRSLRLHPLHGDRSGDWSIVVHDRWRLLVRFEGSTVHLLEVSNHYGD